MRYFHLFYLEEGTLFEKNLCGYLDVQHVHKQVMFQIAMVKFFMKTGLKNFENFMTLLRKLMETSRPHKHAAKSDN